MLTSFRVAVAQINTTVGDIEGNAEKILRAVDAASSFKCDLVLFPELTCTGYPPEDLILNKNFIRANIAEIETIARKVGDIFVLAGYIEDGSPPLNSAALIYSGRIIAKYNKVHLPNYGVFDERRYFQSGDASPVFQINNLKFGVSICEDLWQSSGPHRTQVEDGGAEIIFNLSSSPYCMGKDGQRRALVAERARENDVFVVYSNLVGGQDELVFDGGSLVASPDGEIVATGQQFEEDLVVVDIPVCSAGKPDIETGKNSFNKRSKIKPVIAAIDYKPPARAALEKRAGRQAMGRSEEVYSALVLGVRDYAGKNGFTGAVLGLSGGIDSALTAAIAVDALGKDSVTGITMPSIYSSEGSVSDSEKLSENLGSRIITVPIKRVVEGFEETLCSAFDCDAKGLVMENIQARVRGSILMAFSNQNGCLLLATGNKSEISTGYCTLYGDMAGGFAVIKDVPKMLVYELSEYRNSVAGYDLIPSTILEKEPSAELRPDQKDTDSLPPYPVLDKILAEYVENDRSLKEIASEGISVELAERVIRLVDKSEYKRRQAAPGVKITPRAFGRDRRFPLVNHFREK